MASHYFKSTKPTAEPTAACTSWFTKIGSTLFSLFSGLWGGKPTQLAAQTAVPLVLELDSQESRAWKRVLIYTDGAYEFTSNRMGWGAVICSNATPSTDVLAALSGGSWGGNSPQAEANAIAAALESLPCQTAQVTVFSDCRTILPTLRRALNANSRGVSDGDSGLDLFTLNRIRAAAAGKTVGFKWVKGHSGNILNETADILAAFGSGCELPIHPKQHADHPRAHAARIAGLIKATPSGVI